MFSLCSNIVSFNVFLSLAMDCVMSAWSEWSECSKSCGKGHLIRTRMITLEPQFGGDPCPETIQRKACKIKKCNQGGLNSDERKRRKEDRKKRRNKQGREESADELAGEHALYLTTRDTDNLLTNISNTI